MTTTVAIDVPVSPGSGAGGVEQHLLGLVRSLSLVDTPDLEFVVVVADEETDWLEPYLGPDIRVKARSPSSNGGSRLADKLRSGAERLVRPVLKRQNLHNRFREPSVADAGQTFQDLGADIVHFPTPEYQQTEIPSVYNPHDLQHRHYPENFSAWTVKQRDHLYRTGCEKAAAVAAPSQFVRADIADQYGIPEEKIHVVPRGPPTELYPPITDADIDATRDRYDLPDQFAFYPAQPMAHKNHERLVRALGRLRDDGTDVELVCTGKRTHHWQDVEAVARDVGVGDRIRSLGFIPETDLRACYHLATFVVFPSLFEGGGFPLIEAWAEGAPVACSNTTALGEKAGDAALTFDPESVDEITSAVGRLHDDGTLRNELVERGSARVGEFSWEQTGRRYRRLYRSVAGLATPDEPTD